MRSPHRRCGLFFSRPCNDSASAKKLCEPIPQTAFRLSVKLGSNRRHPPIGKGTAPPRRFFGRSIVFDGKEQPARASSTGITDAYSRRFDAHPTAAGDLGATCAFAGRSSKSCRRTTCGSFVFRNEGARASQASSVAQIPTCEENDLTLFESGAIVLHIAQSHAGLLPNEPSARDHVDLRCAQHGRAADRRVLAGDDLEARLPAA